MESIFFSESQESTDQTIITCENDKNCLDIIADSVCDLKEKVCMCGANKCMMDSKIPRHHHKCNTSADCLMEHTVCDSEKCVCDQMYTYSSDKKKCIKCKKFIFYFLLALLLLLKLFVSGF